VVDRFLAHAAGLPWGPQADPYPTALHGQLADLNIDVQKFNNLRLTAVNALREILRSDGPGRFDLLIHLAATEATIQDQLLTYEETLGREVQASHVDGYSTTARDLLRDLIP
jgi:urease accessory protein UreE